MMRSESERKELGGFLKACRARVDPATLGLPAGRRRTPGLKREEVALAIGVSVSWYTWIEQGREVRASPEVLERLAQVLRMSDDERAYAFALSGYGVPLESPDESVTDGLRQLVEAMQPIPAYVRNTRFDILAWNPAIAELFDKTESAVRITHIPTNIVVACQTGRSQHQNRDNAMKMLAAKLYELEIQKRNAEKDAVEATKSDIGWGSQIRNYVLDQSRIKDLRTGIERSDTQKVLDGDLDEFVEASLKAGLAVGSKRVDA